ncbi:c-type cytochrome [Paraburkholderia guartelaensis]|uniref:C-type cytochrome n=1 Tax=Paraburkholderia guartelaensis TaxID=2546446 RepID=A0A4V2ZUX9_9BURK|nr:c-type cytochrome [Paraburkholderia guartelaensis]TDG02872.1 c-type cytochrome [Paraburkholderia guartelaensis]
MKRSTLFSLTFAFSALLCATISHGATSADAQIAIGQHQFSSSCAMCHATDKSKGTIVGPNLAGVYGRKIGKLSGFQYSEALRASKASWDDAALDAFVKNPQVAQPGTAMPFGGIKNDADRMALVAYLKSLH